MYKTRGIRHTLVYLIMDRSLSLNDILEQVTVKILTDLVDIVLDEKDEKEMMRMMDGIKKKGGGDFSVLWLFLEIKNVTI